MPKDNEKKQLLNFIETEHKGDSGIIYCLSRNKVMEISDWLNKQGYDALPYHAGLDNKIKRRNHRSLYQGRRNNCCCNYCFWHGN